MKFGIRLLLFVINRDNNYVSVGVDILNFDSMRDLIFGWFLVIKMVTHQEKIHSAGMCMRACACLLASTLYVWVPNYLVKMAQKLSSLHVIPEFILLYWRGLSEDLAAETEFYLLPVLFRPY